VLAPIGARKGEDSAVRKATSAHSTSLSAGFRSAQALVASLVQGAHRPMTRAGTKARSVRGTCAASSTTSPIGASSKADCKKVSCWGRTNSQGQTLCMSLRIRRASMIASAKPDRYRIGPYEITPVYHHANRCRRKPRRRVLRRSVHEIARHRCRYAHGKLCLAEPVLFSTRSS
jgi:hypothetical protein